MAEVACTLGWGYTELMDMDAAELCEWHAQAARINKLKAGAAQG